MSRNVRIGESIIVMAQGLTGDSAIVIRGNGNIEMFVSEPPDGQTIPKSAWLAAVLACVVSNKEILQLAELQMVVDMASDAAKNIAKKEAAP